MLENEEIKEVVAEETTKEAVEEETAKETVVEETVKETATEKVVEEVVAEEPKSKEATPKKASSKKDECETETPSIYVKKEDCIAIVDRILAQSARILSSFTIRSAEARAMLNGVKSEIEKLQ